MTKLIPPAKPSLSTPLMRVNPPTTITTSPAPPLVKVPTTLMLGEIKKLIAPIAHDAKTPEIR